VTAKASISPQHSLPVSTSPSQHPSEAPQSRFLALWFPFLSTDRLHRQRARSPSARQAEGAPTEQIGSLSKPLVIVEKVKGALRLAAADPAARALGLSPGLTLADARARVPDIEVCETAPEADRRMLERLADACDRFTPLVGLDGRGGLMLDIAGCVHLFGGEAAMLKDIAGKFETAGFKTFAAIASAPDTSRAMAQFGSGGIVAEGSEEQAVRLLPLAALGLGAEIENGLARAGLRSIGDVAARPRGPLVARFGPELAYRLDLVMGRRRSSITPRRTVGDIIVEKRFGEPIGYEEDIRACLRHLAGQAGELLQERGKGGRLFEAAFFRADGKVTRIPVETARPSRDPAALMRLYDAKLEGLADPLDPGFGFDLIRLSVIFSETLVPEAQELSSKGVPTEEASALVERLSARFTPEQVVRFVSRDTHIPERAAEAIPALSSEQSAITWVVQDSGEPPLRPLFLFTPPHAIDVTASVPDGPPHRFFWRRVEHAIVKAEGPERIAQEWWRDAGQAMTRDYFRLEDTAGRRFWVYREGLYGMEVTNPRWFLHGIFA
jgi:protein ImuB